MNKSIHTLSRAVIVDEDHILLAYDPQDEPFHYYEPGQNFYYLPGGHIEFQESAQKAVVREVKEETGYYSDIERFLGIVEHAWEGKEGCCHTHEVNLIFKVKIPGLKAHDPIIQRENHVAFHWIDLGRLEDIDLRPILLKTALKEWLSPTKPVFYSTML